MTQRQRSGLALFLTLIVLTLVLIAYGNEVFPWPAYIVASIACIWAGVKLAGRD